MAADKITTESVAVVPRRRIQSPSTSSGRAVSATYSRHHELSELARTSTGVGMEGSDAEEIQASRQQPDRFGVIFDRHYAVVHAYLRSRIGSTLAADIAAETFVTAFRRRETYDHAHVNARPWLFGIASNLLRRHHRQERRELRAYARAADQLVTGTAQVPDEPLGGQLARALASLSREEREALFLYACADLSYDEISQALEIPIGTVRSRLSRARGRVRELLEPELAIPREGQSTRRAAHE